MMNRSKTLSLLALALALLIILMAACNKNDGPGESSESDSNTEANVESNSTEPSNTEAPGTDTAGGDEPQVPGGAESDEPDTEVGEDTRGETDTEVGEDTQGSTDTDNGGDTQGGANTEDESDTNGGADTDDSGNTPPVGPILPPQKCETCTYGAWTEVTPATPTKRGKESRACTVCGDTETRFTEKTVLNATSFAELKEGMEAGAEKIQVMNDIVLTETIYVPGTVTLFSQTRDVTLTRSPEFLGDLFVVGTDAEGKNPILLGLQSTLTLKTENGTKLTVDGNKANMTDVKNEGTAFYLLNSATLNLMDDGVSIINHKKLGNGSRFAEDDYSITASQLNRIGGSAVLILSGQLNMYGGTISYNEVNLLDEKNANDTQLATEGYNDSSCGGAIYNYGEVNIYGGTIAENKAARGAAIYNYRYCAVTAGRIVGNDASVYGGAIYMLDTQTANLTLGSATGDKQVEISFNTAEKSGGAIFASHQTSTVILGNTTFEENKSIDGNGGALNMAGGLRIEDATFLNNQAPSDDGKGGAIYAYYSDGDKTVRTVEIHKATFKYNAAPRGGAICLGASEGLLRGANLILGDVLFEENTAFQNSVNKYGRGGAIYATEKSTVEITGTVAEGAKFVGNMSEDDGGAIYLYDGSSLTVTNALFDGNKTTPAHDLSDEENGGAIYSSESTVVVNSSKFVNNLAEQGGALCAMSSTEMTLNDVIVSNNIATLGTLSGTEIVADGDGGAIYASKSTVTIHRGAVNENAADRGGAIYATSNSTLKLYGGETPLTFRGNKSSGNGGALYIYTGVTCVADQILFEDNQSGAYGGAIYASAKSGTSNTTLSAVVAKRNSAEHGGFLYLTTTDCKVTILSGEAGSGEDANVATVTDDAQGRCGSIHVNTTKAILVINAVSDNGEATFTYPDGTLGGKSGIAATEYVPPVESAT